MGILHGSWKLEKQGSYLFIWGETWRKITDGENNPASEIAPHPLGMSGAEFTDFLTSLQQSNRIKWEIPVEKPPEKAKSKQRSRFYQANLQPNTSEYVSEWGIEAIALPTQILETGSPIPLHSGATIPAKTDPNYSSLSLYPWQVEGIRLGTVDALKFLQALPLGGVTEEQNWLGADLRFWSHVTRWTLDLLARGKYLPGLAPQGERMVASWQPLLDSATDQSRFNNFVHLMPLACRTYQGEPEAAAAPDQPPGEGEPEAQEAKIGLCVDLFIPRRVLLRSVLHHLIDLQIRQALTGQSQPQITSVPLRQWLEKLAAPQPQKMAPAVAEKISAIWETWTGPVKHHLAGQQKFRACFELMPPCYGDPHWTLHYFLQAVDNPHCLVKARTIWQNPVDEFIYQGRKIKNPQETLLAGLGLASRIYPPIEASLNQKSPQSCALNPQEAYQFIKAAAWRFEDSGLGVIMPESLSNTGGWASKLGLSIRAETPKVRQGGLGLQSLLNFQWELSIGGQTLTKAEFEKLVALNSPLVEINGEWVELRSPDIKAAQEFFQSRKEQMSLSLEDALRLATGDTQTIQKLPVVNFSAGGQLEELLNTLTNNQALKDIEPPATLKGTLRPYQLRGASWLNFLQNWGLGACLADDMGLGKSVETIAFLLHMQAQNNLLSPVLLVCPTSVLGNWERELKRFGPSLKVMVHHGDKRYKSHQFAIAVQRKNVVLTSYPLLYRDEATFKGVKWQGIILDEAQNIKNPLAKQSQAVRNLEASFRIALTGTPVENKLQELWSILEFLNPGYLGSKQFFQRRFAVPIQKYGDTESLQTLRSLVRPFILRRTKTDKTIIQDLPEKQEMPVFCGLSNEQASLYQKLVDESLAEVESAEGIQRHGIILALLTKLKQICNHPAQFLKEQTLEKGHRSAKLMRLEEMIEELISEGDRALIFTQFAEWGKLLKPYLEQQLGREVLFLYGATRKNQREEMIDRFQEDPQGPPIMILSLKAGGVGLNLTRANHVFHFDRWWNPAVENQATDRVFRIGQTRNVQVHKFVCSGTLEEKIHDLIESKQALAEQVVGSGENWLTDLDTDQLRNLLILDRNAVIDEDE
ncbi:DEAD/DEAH box helicase [Planktothricoides raciborskii]|uniref:DEAD/DEAH box helicase n=1 Tax=Planktothricoides raciborskii GIHE-MW2 TaxID=2792601 RepID=A0AAU8JM23_9CYAN